MHRPTARRDWARFQDRWLDYARSVKAQWPEISFADILATRGVSERLCRSVAETYGLADAEAERAVSIWQASQDEPATQSQRPTTSAA